MLDLIKNEQKTAYEFIEKNHENDSFSHAYIVETNNYDNLGKFIAYFTGRILKNNDYDSILTDSNPDVYFVRPDNGMIRKNQLDELQKKFLTKSVVGGRKVYIMYDADKMNDVSSNSILKFIEEPEENIFAILVVENRFKLLKTILSRCQIIKLKPSDFINNDDQVLNILSSLNNSTRNFNSDSYKYIEDICNRALDFIKCYEETGNNALLKTSSFFGKLVKVDIELFLDIVILYYYDVVTFMCSDKVKVFTDIDMIKTVASKNDIDSISNKIKICVLMKDKLRYNVNSNLLLDKMIMLFDGR